MAAYTFRERTINRKEYSLHTPVAWAELGKVLAAINHDLGDDAQWDDAATVETRDDEIVIWYEREVPGA